MCTNSVTTGVEVKGAQAVVSYGHGETVTLEKNSEGKVMVVASTSDYRAVYSQSSWAAHRNKSARYDVLYTISKFGGGETDLHRWPTLRAWLDEPLKVDPREALLEAKAALEKANRAVELALA